MASGIYSITHAASGKMYIGSAVNLKRRWTEHRGKLISGKHINPKLQNSWTKHGSDAFEFAVIELVADATDLISREQFWMDKYGVAETGFNIAKTAGSQLGLKRSKEAVENIRKASTGRRHTLESKQKISAAHKGKVISEEHRKRVSAASSARTYTAEQREAINAKRRSNKLHKQSISKEIK